MRSLRFALAFAALTGLAAGCEESSTASPPGQPSEPAAALYLGIVDGTETRIAIAQGGSELTAYACGHGATLDEHTRWFSGELDGGDGGAAELTADGWQLHVFADPASMRGELIAPDGRALAWTAARARLDPESEVGLYESFDTGCRSGVIVWEAIPGDACGAQGAWCDETGVRGQVTPAECTADRPLRVRANDYGEPIELIAERVRLP